jgi:endonuclease/exonuclease/phosphatase (EEP) superfamily protein YafD
VLAGAAALTAATALAAVVPTAGAVAGPAARAKAPWSSDVTMVQANIYTGLGVDRFQADVREVLGQQSGPDFVTYNEVPFRNNAVMAPAGRYGIYRDMTNRFTAATPVAWRLDRWTALDHGSWMISDHRGKPPGRVVELGRRYANWVTLESRDGRVLSVVSVHVAPLVDGMPNLIRPSVKRLGMLVEKLAPRGPVLVGGDFNVHYRSSLYPRDLLTTAGLVPIYDTLGRFFPTGDHRGATIDYLFDRGVDTLTVDDAYPVELNSDHDAVVGGFSWQVDAPADTQLVTSSPSAPDKATRRASLSTILSGIRSTPTGATIDVATTRLDLPSVGRKLRHAITRGVHVRLVAAGSEPTAEENRLARVAAASGDAESWVRRCVDACRQAYADAGLPRGFVLVSDASGAWRARYDASRELSSFMLTRRTQVQVRTGPIALDEGARMFSQLG